MRAVHFILFISAVVLSGCEYDDFDSYKPDSSETVVPNADISTVRAMCGEGIYNVTDSIVIAGYVTANDKSGNIYRSFYIEDGTGAVEVRAGMYSLHNAYIRGRYVAVKLCGLNVSLYDGTLQIGLSVNEGGYGVGYLDNWSVAAGFLFPSSQFMDAEPLPLTIPQLLPAHCGRLVRILGLAYMEEKSDEDEISSQSESGLAPNDITWAIPRSETNPVPQALYHTFEDYSGNSIVVYTSGYADFAANALPSGRIRLTGILSYGSTGYMLRLRDIEDVHVEIQD